MFEDRCAALFTELSYLFNGSRAKCARRDAYRTANFSAMVAISPINLPIRCRDSRFRSQSHSKRASRELRIPRGPIIRGKEDERRAGISSSGRASFAPPSSPGDFIRSRAKFSPRASSLPKHTGRSASSMSAQKLEWEERSRARSFLSPSSLPLLARGTCSRRYPSGLEHRRKMQNSPSFLARRA